MNRKLIERAISLLKRALAAPKRIVKRKPKPPPKSISQTVTMYDTITPGVIPRDAEMVAGYVDGIWPTYHETLRLFPHAIHFSITISAFQVADCLDVEKGDAEVRDVVRWCRWQIGLGKAHPWVYSDLSNMVVIKNLLRVAGLAGVVRLWVADPTNVPHIPPGCDACQWTWKAKGLNLDQSLVRRSAL